MVGQFSDNFKGLSKKEVCGGAVCQVHFVKFGCVSEGAKVGCGHFQAVGGGYGVDGDAGPVLALAWGEGFL